MTVPPIENVEAAPPPAPLDEAGYSRLRFYGYVRDIRAEVQNLQRILAEVRQKGGLTDPGLRRTELTAALDARRRLLDPNCHRVELLLADVQRLFSLDAGLYNSAGDEVTHIENDWQRAGVASFVQVDEDVDAFVRRLDEAAAALDELILHAARLTVPNRLNEHLSGLRVGGVLDFEEQFQDELPREADRFSILRYIHAHPTSVFGVVSPQDGVVYRAARSIQRRLLSYALVLASAAIGVPVIYVLTHLGTWFDLEDWAVPTSRTSELLVAYLFLGLGSFAHLLLGSIKQARSGAGRSLLVLGDALLWVHVRETSIAAGLLALPIAIIALAFSLDDVGWETAFFVGYSFDSFLDLFLDRFANLVSTRTSLVRDTMTRAGTS